MSTEDRLKAALEATASTVRDDTLRPLAATARAPRRWPRVAAPLAAALAVLLILGVVSAVARTDTSPTGAAAVSAPSPRLGQRSTCSLRYPAFAAATAQMKEGTRVATGSVDGQAWSLWARKGISGPSAIEDGGVVLGSRWYGLCTGGPNVASFELIDAGAHGTVVGYVQHSGQFRIKLVSGATTVSPTVKRVGGLSFFIGELPRSACSYPSMSFTADGAPDSAQGESNFGTCSPGKPVPVSFGTGAWGAGALAGMAITSVPASVDSPPEICSTADTKISGGQPAGPLTRSAERVASGSAGGRGWSLWVKKGATGVGGVENGGLVLGGRWYGLCPGYPNVLEYELFDAGVHGLVYGYMAASGTHTFSLGPGVLTGIQTSRVLGGTFFIGQLARSACGYPSLTLNTNSAEHQLNFGTCQTSHLVKITSSAGSS
jgi:uncharacterized membrane protein